jgi:hypothetical protein
MAVLPGLKINSNSAGYGGTAIVLEVRGVADAWRECDFNQHQETHPGGRIDPPPPPTSCVLAECGSGGYRTILSP